MKKIYLLAIGLATLTLNAQKGDLVLNAPTLVSTSASHTANKLTNKAAADVLDTEKFETFTLGNAAGQNGYINYNGTAADYKIVNDAARGNYLTITASGGNSSTAGSRYFYKESDDFANAWANRAAGNDILKGEVDIFTGTSTNTGNGRAGVVLFNADGYGVIGITWNANTRTLNGFLALQSLATGDIGSYNLSFGGTPVLNANTWYKIGYEYDHKSGAGTFIFPDGSSYTWDNTSNPDYVVVPNNDPVEIDYLILTNISAARTYGFDNATVVATNEENLSVVNNNSKKTSFSIYPNPTADILHINADKPVQSYRIFDASGKQLMQANTKDSAVNVSKLVKGVYTIQVSTESGTSSTQFIKK